MAARALLIATVVLGCLLHPVAGQGLDKKTEEALAPPDVLDLKLGEDVSVQPGPFREYACGTNGGPPAKALTGLADYAQCAAEPATGLHEIAFRYDDELQYYALAMNLDPIAERYGGTRFGTFPVIASALIGDDGKVHGYRVVTDDRVSLRERRMAYAMGILAKSRIKGDWTCTDLPLENGETPVGRQSIKQDCTGVSAEGGQMRLQARYYHRKGQSQIDPHTGKVREGLYESTARLEVFDAGWKLP